MDTARAIQQGIDAARAQQKDAPSPYHERHPLFRYWWEAAVLKSDIPSRSDLEIKRAIQAKLGKQKKYSL